MGKLVPFQPPPGVFRNGTPYQAKGRWSDCNLVRWKDGRLQPLGGWEKVIGSAITGVGRAMLTWRDFTGDRWMTIGTSSNLYIFTSLSGTASDITPVVTADPSEVALVPGNSSGEIGIGFGTGFFGGFDTKATATGTDISFSSPATIASTSTVFTDATTTAESVPATTTLSPAGPSPFAVGDQIEISGSVDANDRDYPLSHRVVTVVTAGVAGLSDTTPTPSGAWQASQSHSDISQTSTSGSGTEIKFSITTDGSGNPTVTITTVGSGYAASDTIVITDPHVGTSNTATVTVSSIKNQMTIGPTTGSAVYAGTITGLTITTAGSSMTAGSLTATGGAGSGFAGSYTVSSLGSINSVSISNAGSGYTSTPTIVISGLVLGVILTLTPVGPTPANIQPTTYLPDDLSKTFTTSSYSSGISALTPVGPTPASIQPTTSGQWECVNPALTGEPEVTHTNVSQTSTSGSGSGVKFTVVTQLGLVVQSVNIWRASTQISNIPDTSVLSVGMLVHGLSGYGHGTVTPTIVTITNGTTIQLSAANGSGSGSYTGGHVSFQDPTALYLKSVTITTPGIDYVVDDTIVLTDPGNTSYTATVTVNTIATTINTSVTSTAHTLVDGNIVHVSSSGALPGGLSELPASTDLYIIEKTTDTFKLATSSGGDAITLTTLGSGTHTWNNPGTSVPAMWQSGTHNTVSQTSTSGSGNGARFTIVAIQETYLSAVTVTTPGTGYAAGDTIVLTDPGNTSNIATITVSTINAGGVVTADLTGTITTAAADASTPITIKRARRYGNENAKTSSLVLQAASWVFDLWGEVLIGMSTADGRIFKWDPTTSSATSVKATVIPGAPRNNSAILVSKQRHLFALGAGGNKRMIQWSHAESETTWTPTATNQAGSFEIDSYGHIMAGKTVGDRILVWTSTDLHAVDFVGMPYVYGRKKIGDACGALSNRSMIAVGDKAFWMSHGGFFQYQGTVQPLQCDVQDHVFKDINRVQDSKIYASINPEFFEVTWWYASSDSDEILKYVTYNYAEGWWSTGELCRTAFASGSPGVFDNPIGIADDGTIYEHEIGISLEKRTTSQVAVTNSDVSDFDRKLVTGTDATDDVGICFAEAVMEIGSGENIANVTQLITDTSGVGDNGLRFKFKTSYSPNGTESTSSNYNLAADGYTDIREQGRQFTYRVESGFDQYWELGSIRAEMSVGGRR